MNMNNNSALYVNLTTLRENVCSVLSSLSGGAKIIPVLKSDAYGMGMIPFARALSPLPGVEAFAVAHIAEGLALREAGIREEILVMSHPLPSQLSAALEAELTLTVGRLGLLRELSALSLPVRAELKLDTGLHRVGVQPGEELASLLRELREAGNAVTLSGVYSHFVDNENADLCRRQYELFMQGAEQIRAAGFTIPRRHICDSAGSENYSSYHLDAVRLGRRLTMDHPTHPTGTVHELASWRCTVTDIRHRHAGDMLGYGGEYVLPADADIAMISIGYGDGLPVELCRAHGSILIGGKRCPLLCCCMDQSMVDVTGVGCAVGDCATVFGYDENGGFLSVQELAASYGGNEGCGITSALSPRVGRVYENN